MIDFKVSELNIFLYREGFLILIKGLVWINFVILFIRTILQFVYRLEIVTLWNYYSKKLTEPINCWIMLP